VREALVEQVAEGRTVEGQPHLGKQLSLRTGDATRTEHTDLVLWTAGALAAPPAPPILGGACISCIAACMHAHGRMHASPCSGIGLRHSRGLCAANCPSAVSVELIARLA
jgi:hypothetical protein